MGNEVKSFIKNTETVKTSFDSQKITPDSKQSYMGLLFKTRQTNKALSATYANIKAEEIELRKTYKDNAVNEKLSEKKESFKVQVTISKERLFNNLHDISSAKRNEVQNFVVIAPPEDIVNLLNNIQSRIQAGENIGDTEWNMIVRRVSDSGNYQALARLNAMAKSINREFKMYHDIDELLEDIDNVEQIFTSLINKIETPESEWDYWQLAFLSEKNYDNIKVLENLDTMLGASVPEKKPTWRESLMESAKNALKAGDYNLFNETYAFIADNRDQLMTAEEIKQDVLSRAEELYNRGMTAGEK
jgi:hypothetical protein